MAISPMADNLRLGSGYVKCNIAANKVRTVLSCNFT